MCNKSSTMINKDNYSNTEAKTSVTPVLRCRISTFYVNIVVFKQ